MDYVVHRVNTTEKLKNIPEELGIEIDIRHRNNSLVLDHELDGLDTKLDEFLNFYNHGLLVANIKEAGIEEMVIKTMKEKGVSNFFLLDVEFPYIYKNSDKHGEFLSSRFSEFEEISNSTHFENKIKWLWVDTFTKMPINKENLEKIKSFNTCLVSPSRWGRPDEVEDYVNKFNSLNYFPNAIMVEQNEIELWESFLS